MNEATSNVSNRNLDRTSNPYDRNITVAEPLDYQSYQAQRLESLSPEDREVEQKRFDALTPEQRAEQQNAWDILSPDERAHRGAGLRNERWLGPGYILQGQVRLRHTNLDESWKLQGLTVAEIAAKRQAIVDSRNQVNDAAKAERKAIHARRGGVNMTDTEERQAIADNRKQVVAKDLEGRNLGSPDSPRADLIEGRTSSAQIAEQRRVDAANRAS